MVVGEFEACCSFGGLFLDVVGVHGVDTRYRDLCGVMQIVAARSEHKQAHGLCSVSGDGRVSDDAGYFVIEGEDLSVVGRT